MNILQISSVKTWGGGEHHLENLCAELQKTPEVRNFVLCTRGGMLAERLARQDLKVFTAPLLIKSDLRFVFKIGQICSREKIDLIHLHDPTALTLTVMANYLYDLPSFVFSKKTSFPIRKRKQTLFKYNHPKLKKILCVSELTKKIAAAAIEDKDKLQVLYHGTRISDKSTNTPFQLREKLVIQEQVKLIGHIGNHTRPKDLLTWVRTIDFLVNTQQRRDLRFVQIGSFTPQCTPEVQEEIARLKLDPYIHLMGHLANASNFLNQFDLLLLSSSSEGLPQVILEAFYHQVPVVSTAVGGISEVVEHGVNAYLAPAGDPEALGKQVLALLGDPEKINQFKEMGFQKLFPTFTSENMGRQTLKVYQELLPPREAQAHK